ncbi:alkaline shock response membrane anchor protein AmaP [Nocardia terpenica]|uniref:Alkaline shock response membrane anchor protein AmaP n=1 Tax=Nocardia terpenica TaxID=455432 RepID=A0A164JGI1_9NOCA|nr:hypothetical protein [Nocardia terpenica]KZM70381.1 hypothetical protein AWN90_03605 [Nocardia terpenica]MBF6063450.1 alkaline shock response membrane anchor protein AmaP [Nocardia terpenica]MBF6106006.1 alkaline shock response membrane anchor protein AmaP [Nocardia terpenica]MBF6113409.1 alkaline shock response membrane anchor protein AmaP [Nocardia terpenica]MBF6119747.1 alkaline shock response membrane anchor protein AmaP [Nocardia terpenica]
MTVRPRPSRLNRALLAVAGLLLIVAGGLALAAHYGRLTWVNPRSPLLPGEVRAPGWALWVIVALAAVLGLACLRWASAQVTRMPPPARWRARPEECADTVVLHSPTVAGPVAADIGDYAGVCSAEAWLSGPGRAPVLHLVVTAVPDADIRALRRRILAHAVPRLRQALEVDAIPVTLEVRLAQRR